MTEEKLLELLRSVDAQAVRVPKEIRDLAAAIEEAERDRCARICDEVAWLNKHSQTIAAMGLSEAEQCAKAIRD